MIDQVRELVAAADRLIEAIAVTRSDAQHELTTRRLDTARRRLVHVRNVLEIELRDQELERGIGALVCVPRHDYERRSPS